MDADSYFMVLSNVLRGQDWVSAPGQMTMGELSDMQYAQRLAAGDGDAYSASSSGIAGIMRRHEAKQRENQKLTETAFGDIDSLMDK